jgi:putative FmdB family regulatory protein
MPTYVYKCQKCGEEHEGTSTIAKAPQKIKCIFCGSWAKRIISRTHFVLKGSGWAKDGYK